MSRITVERHGADRIKLTGWIGPTTPELCKRVGAGRFTPKDKGGPFWTYPLDLGTCRRFRSVFGQSLSIGPDLNSWARAAVEAEASLHALAGTVDADLRWTPEIAPAIDLATRNRTYQRVAAVFGAQAGSFLLADQPGLGKTVETFATIIEHTADRPDTQFHLVFSPSVAVLNVWEPEAVRWLEAHDTVVLPLVGTLGHREDLLNSLTATLEGRATPPRHVFVVANIESTRIRPEKDDYTGKVTWDTANALVPSLFARTWDTLVVDESHRALIRRKGQPSQQRAGFIRLKSNRRIALSGTPMRGKPEQLWGTLNWLRPDVYTSYWNWVGLYWNLESNGYSNYVLGDFQPGGEDRLAADLKSIVLRRTKAEVLPELPPKTYAGRYLIPGDESSPHGIWLELSPSHRKQVDEFMFEGSLDFGDEGELIANGVLADYTRRKQLSSAKHELINGVLWPTLDSPKFEWLLQFVEQLDGQRVVVASQFRKFLEVVAKGLEAEGYDVHLLTGKTKSRGKTMVEDFQSDNPAKTIFLLQTQAGGVSLTLDAADYLVLLDETTIPDDQEQVEDRIHRTSRIHNVTIYYLRTLGTQDEEVAWVAAARENVQKYLLDGARGVEYAKRVYLEAKTVSAE